MRKLCCSNMKTFIVLITVLASGSANTIDRAPGWGSSASGRPKPKPSINIGLGATAAAAATGQASANQALIQNAAGSIAGAAHLQSQSGSIGSVIQGEQIGQVISVDKPSGISSSINLSDVQNIGIAQDSLSGYLDGSVGASASNSAVSQLSGEGSAAEEAISVVNFAMKN